MLENIILKYLKLFYATEITFGQALKIVKNDPYLTNLTLNFINNNNKGDKNNATIETTIAREQEIEQDLQWLQEKDNHIITYNDPCYPQLLKETATPPILLFVKGDPDLLAKPQIAIVGSRKASLYGCKVATSFAANLASCGMVITSGLALGIDGVAHKSALEHGKTIAVLGSGLEYIYPYVHRSLAKEIINNGAIVSEFSLRSRPNKYNFPRRNRIISGLSLGVLVVEASEKSGSIITAKQALEQNREVFVIPNSIYNTNYEGCHALIRQGAKLVDKVEHILEELESFVDLLNYDTHGTKPDFTDCNLLAKLSAVEPTLKPALAQLPQKYATLLGHIKAGVVTMEDLSIVTKFEVEELNSMLIYLELEGYIGSDSGSYVSLVKSKT